MSGNSFTAVLTGRVSNLVCARAFAAGAAVLLAGLAGCQSGGGSAGSAEGKSEATAPAAGASVDRDAWGRVGYRLVWTGYAVLSDGGRVTQFENLGDGLVVQDSGSVVTALSPTSGEIKWATPVGSPLTRFVGISREGNRYIVCSESEAFFMASDSGTLLARQRFDRVVNTRPVNNGALLVFGTSGGDVLGHLMSGFKAWAYAIGGSFEADPISIGGEYVGLVSQNGRVIIISPITGSAASQYRTFGGLACNPAASDSRLFVASLDQSIYAFDVFGTQPAWRKRTDSALRTTPTYHDGKLYVEVPSSGLLCLDAKTGRDLWAAKGVSGTVIASSRGKLLVWNGSEAVTLDPSNGDVVERAALPGLVALKPDRFTDGNLYAVTPSGAVHKFEMK